jgi:UDP-N-acetylglucosamine 2-epimerase (non-hydrolysing)
MKKILCIVGTRPNYMKMAPMLKAFDSHNPPLPYVLVHTGQHFDPNMEKVFFEALDMAPASVNLSVGAGNHAIQTGEMMKRLDPVFDEYNPGCTLVVGDVNSTLAAALVSSKRGVPVIHVEAGLRSNDRTMPEELNRIVTDQLSDLLFTTEKVAATTLQGEGIHAERIAFVGNVMIDTLELFRGNSVSAAATVRDTAKVDLTTWAPKGYALVTLHRPSNVDDPVVFADLIETLNRVSESLPIIFPIHPRTKGNIEKFGLSSQISSRWLLLPPQGYLEMVGLMRDSKVVLTDSGGIQEETTMLGVACLTLRKNTERPITVTEGTNSLVGIERGPILAAFNEIFAGRGKTGQRPELWDGHASERIAAEIYRRAGQLL